MATVTFAGSTIWNDASTGIGRINGAINGETIAWVAERVPGGNGLIMKDTGTDPARVVLVLDYILTASETNSLLSTLAGLKGSAGTVAFASTSVSYCVLMSYQLQRGQWALRNGGSGGYETRIVFEFQQYRGTS